MLEACTLAYLGLFTNHHHNRSSISRNTPRFCTSPESELSSHTLPRLVCGPCSECPSWPGLDKLEVIIRVGED
jgi:hypothetical protein